MEITISTILTWVSAGFIACLAFAIYQFGAKDNSTRSFALLSFVVSLWSVSVPFSGLFWVKMSYFLATVITSSFLLFSLTYPENLKVRKISLLLIALSELIFLLLFFFTDVIISISLTTNPSEIGQATWSFGKFGFLFDSYVICVWLLGIYFLIKKYTLLKRGVIKTNLGYVIAAIIVGIIPPVITGALLPRLGIFDFYWLAPVSGLIWLSIISLAILRHHLFNIKVIAVELVTFTLWIVILLRTVLSETREDMLIQGGLLLISVILGIVLIRSVLGEIHQRQQIERLAKEIKTAYARVREINEHLEERIAEQTRDVRRAYEVEKKARAELEQLNKTKDEFITSTQHNLRTPLTSLKWELESIRKGTAGPVNSELKNILDTADESAHNLENIIENFIKITEGGV
jgi:hypothetical protein